MNKFIIKNRSGMIANVNFQLVKSKLFSDTVSWKEKHIQYQCVKQCILHLETKRKPP